MSTDILDALREKDQCIHICTLKEKSIFFYNIKFITSFGAGYCLLELRRPTADLTPHDKFVSTESRPTAILA